LPVSYQEVNVAVQGFALRMSAIIGDTYPEVDVPPAGERLRKLRAGEIRGEVVIYPAGADFPRATVEWHPGHGFVVWCLDSEQSIGHFLARATLTSEPVVETTLGGQAMEKWPPELLVSETLAAEALTFLAESGGRKPDLAWIAADQFPRKTVWAGTPGRLAWERARPQ
jgi:hypothetical protein